jgi:hypothetical protein
LQLLGGEVWLEGLHWGASAVDLVAGDGAEDF